MPDNPFQTPDPPDYDGIERSKWEKAKYLVKDELRDRSPRLAKRVETFISRFGYERKNVFSKIGVDEMFAAHFAKEPRRTGMHEDVAANWIKNLGGQWVFNFKVLPKSGKNSVKVSSDGNIVLASTFSNLPGKSLDFTWKTGKTTFYAMHKYTKEGGGNQDSQYKEMLELMKRFLHCRDRSVALAVIVDGPYYTEQRNKRLKELQEHQRSLDPKSFAIPIEFLPMILNDYAIVDQK